MGVRREGSKGMEKGVGRWGRGVRREKGSGEGKTVGR